MGESDSLTEGAFVQAFKAEMEAATHETLVETYCWANRMGYGDDLGLRERGEAWAKRIEDAGAAQDVLLALARAREEST